MLGLAVLVLGGAIVMVIHSFPTTSATTSTTHPATSPSGAQAATAQSTAGDWIPLRSRAPADVLAAARQSSLFQQNLAGSGDHVTDLSHLGTPVLVRALQPAGAATGQFPDFYVVPILNASGAATDAAELALNPAQSAIHVIAIVTYSQPHAQGAIAQRTVANAVATVQAQQHTALRAGASPQLVYFPADATAQETGQITWTGGGEFPADPIWLVPGADGHDHLIGDDGHVYSPAQLPMVKLAP